MTESIVSLKGFVKRYGGFLAVDKLSLEIKRGEIFALLGPNGAGKTSTLECLEGLRRADAGEIKILGLDPIKDSRALMKRVGVQLQAQGLPGAMTVGEALRFFARYRGLDPDQSLASRFGLGSKLGVQTAALSTGQQRRLALALAFQGSPELVILDEPTAGLDVENRDELHRLMGERHGAGTTILLATHDMAEAEKLADRAAVLVKGQLAATGSPRELTSQGEGRTRISISTTRNILMEAAPDFSGAERLSPEGAYAIYRTAHPAAVLSELFAWLENRGDEILDLRVERPSLEDRFLEIVKRRAA